jgi:hypothetical protein
MVGMSTRPIAENAKRGCWPRWLMWLLAIFGVILLGILIAPAVFQARTAASLHQRSSLMHLVLTDLRDYDQTFGHLPAVCEKDPAGECTLSWRVALLFYMGGRPLPSRPSPENPWDSVKNLQYLRESVLQFCEPPSTDTVMLAVTGKGAAFDAAGSQRLRDMDPNTIVLIENRRAGVHWLAPIEFDAEPLLGTSGEEKWNRLMAEFGERGFHIGFADGAVWRLSTDVPLDRIRDFFFTDGMRELDRDQELKRFALHVSPR